MSFWLETYYSYQFKAKKKKYFLSEYVNKLKQRGKGRSSIISDDNNMPSTIYKCYTAEPFELFFCVMKEGYDHNCKIIVSWH